MEDAIKKMAELGVSFDAQEVGTSSAVQEPAPTPKRRGRKPKSAIEGATAQPTQEKKDKSVPDASAESWYAPLIQRNVVKGFDPYKAVVAYPQPDGTVKLHMPVVVAMQWFLTRYPEGHAELTYNEKFSRENYAVFDCQLYSDADTKLGFSGSGACAYGEGNEVQMNYVQSAQTKAISCALRNNGFCAPYDATYIKGVTRIADSIPYEGADDSADKAVTESTIKPAETTKPNPAPAKAKPESEPVVDEPKIMVDDDSSAAAEPVAEPAAEPKHKAEPMPIDEALAFKVPTGPAKGLSMKETYEKHGGAYIRMYTAARYKGQDVFRAAKAVCNFYNI